MTTTTAPATIVLRAEAWTNREGTAPAGYGFSAFVRTFEEAQEFAARFPKSAGMIACHLSGDPEHKAMVRVKNTSLAPNKVRGDKNEAAIKRYHSAVRAIEKLEIPTVWISRYQNSYAGREEFEAAL